MSGRKVYELILKCESCFRTSLIDGAVGMVKLKKVAINKGWNLSKNKETCPLCTLYFKLQAEIHNTKKRKKRISV